MQTFSGALGTVKNESPPRSHAGHVAQDSYGVPQSNVVQDSYGVPQSPVVSHKGNQDVPGRVAI